MSVGSDLNVGVVVTAKVGNAVREVGKATKSMRGDTARVAQAQKDLSRANEAAGRSTGRLGQALAGAGRRAAGMARDAASAVGKIRMLGGVAGTAGRALDRIGNRYAALITGAAGVGVARFIGNLQERFTRIGIQAGLSANEVEKLKRQVFEVSRQKGIRVDPGETTAGIEKILGKIGDIKLAKDNLENIALVIQAAGAAGENAGAMISDMAEKFNIRDPGEIRKMLDTLVVQGKAGAFELRDLASQGERVTAAYAAMGRTGPLAVREMGALLQMARKGTGGAEEAATAFETLMKGIVENSKELEGMGVTIWDEEKLAEGKKVARSAIDIVKDLVTETEGDIEKLTDIFDSRAMRAITVLKTEFSETGDFKTLDSFMNILGDGKQLMADSATAADTANASMRNLISAWQVFADTRLTGPIQSLADLMNAMSSEKMDTLMSVLATGAGVLGAAVIGRKVYKASAAIGGMFGKKGAAGIGGAALAAAGGPTPVIVTNWPAGGVGGFGGGKGGKGRKPAPWGAGKASRWNLPKMPAGIGAGLKGAGKLLGRVAMPVMVGMSLMDMVGSAVSGDAKGVGSGLGGLGGTLAGAAAGAAIGSVVPVIGTAIGGIIGGLAGSFSGEALGGWIGGLFGKGEAKTSAPAEPNAAAQPATAATVAPVARTVHQTIQITVQATPGMDEESLARRIKRMIGEQTEEALHE